MLKTFVYHKPTEHSHQQIAAMRESFSKLLIQIKMTCPESREKSIAITNLETTAMWAIKAIVTNDPDSVVTLD